MAGRGGELTMPRNCGSRQWSDVWSRRAGAPIVAPKVFELPVVRSWATQEAGGGTCRMTGDCFVGVCVSWTVAGICRPGSARRG